MWINTTKISPLAAIYYEIYDLKSRNSDIQYISAIKIGLVFAYKRAIAQANNLWQVKGDLESDCKRTIAKPKIYDKWKETLDHK